METFDCKDPPSVPETPDEADLDPFKRSKNGLLVTKGFVNNKKARILFDPGSEISYISTDFCNKNNIETIETEQFASMANKTTEKMSRTKEPIILNIRGYTEKVHLASMKLHHDIILGKKWCDDHQTIIDFSTNEITFKYKDKEYILTAMEYYKSQFISINNIMKDIENGLPCFAITVKKEDLSKKGSRPREIDALLSEFADVFPEKLPKGLPPNRSKNFDIQLTEDAKPRKSGLYRMSPAELKELRKQLDELLEAEFIRPSESPWGAPVLFATKKRWYTKIMYRLKSA